MGRKRKNHRRRHKSVYSLLLLRYSLLILVVIACRSAIAQDQPSSPAAGIEPGLWKVVTHTDSGGGAGLPHESSKCLTAAETSDLGTTFSPVPRTINSACAPIERSLKGPLLTWHLVCKGQLDMDLSGQFNFDSPHHYSGTVHTKAAMAGRTMLDTVNVIEGQWVSACPQQ